MAAATAKKVSVVLADGHPASRQALRRLIQGVDPLKIVGEAADGRSALTLMQEKRPDLTIMEEHLPGLDGLSVLARLKRAGSPAGIVLLASPGSEQSIFHALDLGARGYLLKENAEKFLIDCLDTVMAGSCFLDPIVAGMLIAQKQQVKQFLAQRPQLNRLSGSERRILKLVAENKTSPEIAQMLLLSPLTIETHRRNICKKLGLKGSHRLLRFAVHHQRELGELFQLS